MKTIVFLCVENSCRSQIAEAFGKMMGADRYQFFSAGSEPSGKVNPKAIKSMSDIGYDMSCLLYTSPSPRDATLSRMPSSA